ncbi:MAG TPA: hypothetical protein VNH42_05165 [Mariprofundaceae bacterium]|nr:hypothetical protein [Mariprofundaceae bacterium]
MIQKQLDAFERGFDYDVGYVREILDISVRALMRFNAVSKMGRYCHGLPRSAWYAAKLTATMIEDCGPCTQLVATMAERDGVPPAVLQGILTADRQLMDEDAALGVAFTRAVLLRDPRAESLREMVLGCWGREGLLSLAFAMTASRMFPTMKYALGHGRACVSVRVGSRDVRPCKVSSGVEAV